MKQRAGGPHDGNHRRITGGGEGTVRPAVSLLALVALATLLAGCPPPKPPPPPPKPAPKVTAPAKVEWRMSKSGLGYRLSDADPPAAPKRKLAQTVPLSRQDTARVLKRLPAIQAARAKPFALPSKSRPAPRPGKTIRTPFPPPVTKAPAPATVAKRGSPLRLLRHAPEGAVELAPNLSITFSEPMVPVTSIGELAKQGPPVLLSPLPKGTWRWVGTQTVLFQPAKRFAMATSYRVEVPVTTRSVGGKALAAPARWGFETPALRITDMRPGTYARSVKLEPTLVLAFNQRIDPKVLLGHLELHADGEPQDLRLATADEIEQDGDVRRHTQRLTADQWLALRLARPLPKDAAVELSLKTGAPSAEGPKRTRQPQRRSFRTFAPLKLVELSCNWGSRCTPLAPFRLRFNNALDEDSFDPAMVAVDPPLEGMRVTASYRGIVIAGRSKGRTEYRVTVAASLRDAHDQTLGAPVTQTVKVGDAEPVLFPEQDTMVVLDPAFDPAFGVYSVNRKALRVRLYRVEPKDYAAYVAFRNDWDHDQKVTRPPGKLVHSQVVRPRAARDELIHTAVDLSPALTGGLGQVITIVEPTTPPRRDRWGGIHKEWVRCWVQSTRLGLQAFVDQQEVHGWASQLGNGAPLGDVEVGVLPQGASGRTGADGIVKLPLGAKGALLYARHGKDVVILPGGQRWYDDDAFTRRTTLDRLRWFVLDDRGLYKPGETAHFKGWVRRIGLGKGGDVSGLPSAGRHRVGYRALDGRGSELAKGELSLDDSGGFHVAVPLPDDANLGSGRLELRLVKSLAGLGSHRHTHRFKIQAFRRPEYEVTTTVSEGPHFVGTHAIATAAASYYAGGGLPDAKVRWRVSSRFAHFVPPGRRGFHFGKPVSNWWWGRGEPEIDTETWEARTGPGGAHRLRIDFDALEQAYPRRLALESTVTDVNRQAWTGRASLIVHPADVTVGVRQQAAFVRAGSKLALDAIVTDRDGKAVAGREVKLRLARIEWKRVKGEQSATEHDVETCQLTSTEKVAHCLLSTHKAGPHRVTARVTDVHGRQSQTQLRVYVLGPSLPVNPMVSQGKVELLADRQDYRPGDRAKLLVMAPFAPAEGVLTLRRQGVVSLRRFRMESTSQLLEVPIFDAHVPNVIAQVDLVGAQTRDDAQGDPDGTLPPRPALATGKVELKVPPRDRTLKIEVTPKRRTVQPGATTTISLGVQDARGAPVKDGKLALVVVDESVLALTGYQLPDPLEVFYARRSEGVSDVEMRLRVALMHPDLARFQLRARRSRNGNGDPVAGALADLEVQTVGALSFNGDNGHPPAAPNGSPPPPPSPYEVPDPLEAKAKRPDKPPTPLAVRTDFRPLAAFVPNVTTDRRGRAEVTVKLPDSLTRYRVMAVGASGERQFGSAESTITARLPLMVRPSPPRFLNYGDRFALPVVLQNQTNKPLRVDLATRAANARLVDVIGKRVTVPARDRVEVRFGAAAAQPGTARIQVGALSKAGTDASEHAIPVWTPATTEAFATYGQIDAGAVAQRMVPPRDAVPTIGGLELTTSSTALQGLTDAVLYLVSYPFECNEQVASRVMAVAALRDVLDAFRAEGLPKPAELVARVSADIERLRSKQHHSGGWNWWRKDRQPVPYVSIHVAHALVRAKDKGFAVPEAMLRRALGYLANIGWRIPAHYPAEVKRSLRAYAVYVRHLAGQPDPAEARRLVREAGGAAKMPLEALGWLLPVLSKDARSQAQVRAIRRHLENRVTETAGAAHFAASYQDGAHLLLHSSRRADAILLDALIDDQPESDLIAKIVKGLLAHRKRGRWHNTQENAFVLLALDRYFQTYEKTTPAFVAQAWLGKQFVGEHRFQGRSTDRQHVEVPMSYLAKQGKASDLLLAKRGDGRLYYRLGMSYAPRSLKLPPVEQGFSVSRTYEPVDDPGDVRRAADGSWRIKAGALVRVRLSMVVPTRRYHVALVDPLPAGLEPLNPELATTGTIPNDSRDPSGNQPWWWSRPWYEHQNLRDDRVEAFASLVWAGVYDYSYVARATTPGAFVAPPTKAEEMYAPETFGRGASHAVIVQ